MNKLASPDRGESASLFGKAAHTVAVDTNHRDRIGRAMESYYVQRDGRQNLFADYEAARNEAARVREHVVSHLDTYLDQFVRNATGRGIKVYWATTGEEACEYVLSVAAARGAKHVIKSKMMTSEEIELNTALEKAGLHVVESDLGEYIVQLREEPPYHFVFPAMHLSRQQSSTLFSDKLGTAPTDESEELVQIARRVLRDGFLQADVGIT